MKQLLIILTLLAVCPTARSQVGFNVTINDKDFTLTELEFNDCYGDAFDRMVKRGVTKEKYFDLWTKTFTKWKSMVKYKVIIIETIGDRLHSISYTDTGDPAYDGVRPDGSRAKGSPHDKDNVSKRVAMLNTYVSDALVKRLTGKTLKAY